MVAIEGYKSLTYLNLLICARIRPIIDKDPYSDLPISATAPRQI